MTFDPCLFFKFCELDKFLHNLALVAFTPYTHFNTSSPVQLPHQQSLNNSQCVSLPSSLLFSPSSLLLWLWLMEKFLFMLLSEVTAKAVSNTSTRKTKRNSSGKELWRRNVETVSMNEQLRLNPILLCIAIPTGLATLC
ncbi:hypothetical protein TREMEDRAFT_72364 [Tremella mesenterica DSM 1558]|uniref:uncharacterized protein n=1 Tax=Tremella mesenterica (strain ATCC 24925 / CBS 8224 / DSM 1558 / NBRC 9311 / NRRL Y-6157 / RJB 2259-6 / UBC 559-6) TaxID=578456 RepID=UPI00032C0425|nr:uncharacterized protein TREMEDRAFT_72364 [Tremella mesenterica DSM 1558]EIW66521.1 hypothetical protein TREMEDRAFT_72364 [Tremella mesenterica DSM 1558]